MYNIHAKPRGTGIYSFFYIDTPSLPLYLLSSPLTLAHQSIYRPIDRCRLYSHRFFYLSIILFYPIYYNP